MVLTFDQNSVCTAYTNFEKQKITNWKNRFKEIKALCVKHREWLINSMNSYKYVQESFGK